MKTDSILTAMSELSGASDIPVSLIRHSARRSANRNRADVQTAGAAIIPLRFAHAACSA